MKNRISKVFNLTLVCFLIYFSISILFEVFNYSWEPFDRINLISDVLRSDKDSINSPKKDSIIATKLNDSLSEKRDFELYKKPQFITNFQTGNQSALPYFTEKLSRLKSGEKIKIRIAYFGDSMIEGDLLTQTLRSLFQAEYGGSGVGFLPITSNVSGFRQTATASGKGWNDVNFKSKGVQNLYLSGHYFTGQGSASFTDNTITDQGVPIEKSLIFGKTEFGSINYNGTSVPLYSNAMVNRQVLSKDDSKQIKISSGDSNSVYYGVSFESESGIFIDNFSFRGITGVELNKLNEDFMKSIQDANHYDLIVFQYGVNLLFRPKDTNYDYYAKMMMPVLAKMKNAFSDADFMIISSADRAFRYDGTYKTAIGLPNLIETQALMAFENNFAFYNQFETMGGTNSIVKWASENPPLANKDYVHPNHRGAEVLAKKLFEAFQNDYQKYISAKNNGQ